MPALGWADVCRCPAMGNPALTHARIDRKMLMPVHRGKDSHGPYYQWGDSGKKYHYEAGSKPSREAAKKKATKQGQAARARGYKG